MTNWIPDVNRFNLAQPPDFWLRQLWDFDDSLVVVPSRQSPIYRLAQRRPLNLPIKMVNDALFNESDTKLLASYSLIPVTSIMATPNWTDPYMFVELKNRAPHRLGGANKVIDELEAGEQQAELRKQFATEEHLRYLGKDAWNLYLKKIGLKSHMYTPRSKASLVSSNAPSIRIK